MQSRLRLNCVSLRTSLILFSHLLLGRRGAPFPSEFLTELVYACPVHDSVISGTEQVLNFLVVHFFLYSCCILSVWLQVFPTTRSISYALNLGRVTAFHTHTKQASSWKRCQ
jgi:hypothetical protein